MALAACGKATPTPNLTPVPAGTVTPAGSPTPTNTPTFNAAGQRVAAVGDTVSVTYTGTLDDGTVFDSTEKDGGTPMSFVVGSGQLIAGFDQAVRGMAVGDEKTVTLTPDQAYGQRSPSLIFDIPLANVPEGTQEGDVLYSSSTGQPVTVTSIAGATVTIDANPPLAGKTLTFDIQVNDIQ